MISNVLVLTSIHDRNFGMELFCFQGENVMIDSPYIYLLIDVT